MSIVMVEGKAMVPFDDLSAAEMHRINGIEMKKFCEEVAQEFPTLKSISK